MEKVFGPMRKMADHGGKGNETIRPDHPNGHSKMGSTTDSTTFSITTTPSVQAVVFVSGKQAQERVDVNSLKGRKGNNNGKLSSIFQQPKLSLASSWNSMGSGLKSVKGDPKLSEVYEESEEGQTNSVNRKGRGRKSSGNLEKRPANFSIRGTAVTSYYQLEPSGSDPSSSSTGSTTKLQTIMFDREYTPGDIAEYIFWTGDERGVAIAVNDLFNDGLMASRDDVITFLEQVNSELKYLRDQYQASRSSRHANTGTSSSSLGSPLPISRSSRRRITKRDVDGGSGFTSINSEMFPSSSDEEDESDEEEAGNVEEGNGTATSDLNDPLTSMNRNRDQS